MVHLVLPALIPDIPKVYDIYFKAFNNDHMGQIMVDILFPGGVNDEFKKAHAAGTLQYWHTSESQFTFKCVDTITGEIVGMGLGDLYLKERTSEERQNHGVPWLEGAQRERAEAILNPLHDVREELFGGQKYIYCHVIGVDPKYQGLKAGAALVQWGVELCERSILPIYFESSPSTVGLYKKMGFEILKEKIVHKAEVLGTKEDIEVPLMVRMPSASNMSFYEWKEKGYPSLEEEAKKQRAQAQAPAPTPATSTVPAKPMGASTKVEVPTKETVEEFVPTPVKKRFSSLGWFGKKRAKDGAGLPTSGNSGLVV